MKTNNIRQISQIAARTLKIVGAIMIVATFLDFIVMLIPADFLNRVWQINLVTQLVDRGIIPMIGIALLLTGIWMTDTVVNNNSDLPSGGFNFKNIIFFFCLIMGIIYLALFPLHLSNASAAQAEAMKQIESQAAQAQQQIEAQISSPEFQNQMQQRKNALKQQIADLTKDPNQLDQMLKSQQVPAQMKTLLEQSKQNPKAIDEFLAQQEQALPNQLLGRVKDQKDKLEQQAKTAAMKSTFQTGLRSLLLAIGYGLIGFTSLKTMGVFGGKGQRGMERI